MGKKRNLAGKGLRISLGYLLHIKMAVLAVAVPALSQPDYSQTQQPKIVPIDSNFVRLPLTLVPLQPSVDQPTLTPLPPDKSQPQPTLIPARPLDGQPKQELPSIIPCSSAICQVPRIKI